MGFLHDMLPSPYCVTRLQWVNIVCSRYLVAALLAICAGNSPVPDEFSAQRPLTQSFDVFFDLRLNKRLRKQSWGWWFGTLSHPLWRHCNDYWLRSVHTVTPRKCHIIYEEKNSRHVVFFSLERLIIFFFYISFRCIFRYARNVCKSAIRLIWYNPIRFDTNVLHDDVIKWKHFPRNWPFVRGIHRSPVNSPHKGQWRGALMFSLICVWINNREAGDLRRYRAHYDVIVMKNVKLLKPNDGNQTFSFKKMHLKMSSVKWRLFWLAWWRHQMETFYASQSICAGNSPVPGEFPAQRPVMRSFDIFFDMRPNKRLSKQSWGWWFETPSHPLWRHVMRPQCVK